MFYVDTHFVDNADVKMLYIMKGYGLVGEYDYVWQAKDRVCFSESYLARLIATLETGPDVAIGMYPHKRWNADRAYNQLVYYDPAEFYRDYGFYTTNWEMLCFNVNTLIKGTEWGKYEEAYRDNDRSPFFRYTWLFERLAGLSDSRMVFCPYEGEDLYVSANATSGWWDEIYSIWIDKWVAANYDLPSVYDPSGFPRCIASRNIMHC